MSKNGFNVFKASLVVFKHRQDFVIFNDSFYYLIIIWNIELLKCNSTGTINVLCDNFFKH